MGRVNKTFRLNQDVVEYMAERVREGDAPSQTALIENLIRREKERREREEFRRRRDEDYRRAWSDPEYVAEIEQIEREFEPLDVEAWKMVDMGDPDPRYSAGRSSARRSTRPKATSRPASGPRS
jgi:hypothetical protein